jgi:hypothetical protein
MMEIQLKPVDYKSDVEPTWCSGCGDFGVVAALTRAYAELGLRPENIVSVSGIGCSSRLPLFVKNYSVHSLHGRAIPVAIGIKLARPDLTVIVETGDGEFPSVWTNIHTYRRFKATRRGLRASMSPGSTLSPHNLSERLTNALRAYFFGGFLSFPTWDKNKYSTPRSVVKGKKLDVCLYKTTRSDTGFKDLFSIGAGHNPHAA